MLQQPKANVSILVIFVMIACSLMGLLAMHFVQQMLKYSDSVGDYYKSYYLTKAGIEIGLTEANIRGIGFSTTIGSEFFKENFNCERRCELNTQVIGKTSQLKKNFWEEGKCTTGNAFHLKKGELLAIPLFLENTPETQKQILEAERTYTGFTINQNNLSLISLDYNSGVKINLGIVGVKKKDNKLGTENSSISYFDQRKIAQDTIKSFLQEFFNKKRPKEESEELKNSFLYLLIGNQKKEKELVFCLETGNNPYSNKKKELPTQKFWIESTARYDNTMMTLQAEYKQAIPELFFNVGGFEK